MTRHVRRIEWPDFAQKEYSSVRKENVHEIQLCAAQESGAGILQQIREGQCHAD